MLRTKILQRLTMEACSLDSSWINVMPVIEVPGASTMLTVSGVQSGSSCSFVQGLQNGRT